MGKNKVEEKFGSEQLFTIFGEWTEGDQEKGARYIHRIIRIHSTKEKRELVYERKPREDGVDGYVYSKVSDNEIVNMRREEGGLRFTIKVLIRKGKESEVVEERYEEKFVPKEKLTLNPTIV